MRRIKIPLQDFVLQMQGGGLCVRGGIFMGHYGICILPYIYISFSLFMLGSLHAPSEEDG